MNSISNAVQAVDSDLPLCLCESTLLRELLLLQLLPFMRDHIFLHGTQMEE